MSAYLNENQLKDALEILLKKMEDKGIKIKEEKRIEIKNEIAEELDGHLTQHDIKDPNVQKKLFACITSKIMGKDKDFNFLIDSLTSDHKDRPDIGLDTKLKAEFMILAMLSNVLNPDVKKEKVLTPNEFKQEFLKAKQEKMKNPTDEKELLENNLIEKQMDASLRNLNAGDNPNINGEENFPILGPTFGNLFAFTNQTRKDPTFYSEMVESITDNKGKVDYLGLEQNNLVDDLAQGAIDMSPVFSYRNIPGG